MYNVLNKNTFNCIMCAKRTLDQSFFQAGLCNYSRSNLLAWFNLLHRFLKIYFKLGILFGVVAEDKCFCWFNTVAKPADKVIVIDPGLEPFSVQFNQNLQQSEVEIFLF